MGMMQKFKHNLFTIIFINTNIYLFITIILHFFFPNCCYTSMKALNDLLLENDFV